MAKKKAKTTFASARSAPKAPNPAREVEARSLFDATPQPSTVQQLAPIGLLRHPGAAQYLEVRDPTRQLTDVVLDAENARLLDSLRSEFRHADDIRRHGLAPRSKVLFCGPPGCGKTVTAEAFARELALPLVTMRLETVISSYLGETASNLAKVFEAVQRQPCVLFLDEFDAIARTRTAAQEHNELRRVVNSLLLLIDGFHGRGFLVAATNLDDALDGAIWRRFDEVMFFGGPNITQIRQLMKLRTKNFASDFDLSLRAGDLKGMSYAEIERICLESIRRAIVRRSKSFSIDDFEIALKSERRRQAIRRRAKNRVEGVET